MTNRAYGGVSATLSYDVLDHFVQWNAASNNQEWYAYDATGSRVLRRSTTGITIYAFGLEEHAYNATGNNTDNTYYYKLPGMLVGELHGTTTQYFLTDELGSVLSAFNAIAGGAAVTGNQAYGPYGNQRYHAGSMSTSKGFTGQYQDATGLDFYNARYYDPIVGQFISADVVESNMIGMDPYTYVGGNPETKNDPTGLANDPTLIYVALWYKTLHSGDAVYADVPTMRLPGVGQTKAAPDLVNATLGQVWEAKTGMPGLESGGGGLVNYGTDAPAPNTVASASGQLAGYIQTLNSQLSGKSQTGTWEAGSLARDPALAAFFDNWPYCTGRGPGSVCSVEFPDGSIMNIVNPMKDGVLVYAMSRVGPPLPFPAVFTVPSKVIAAVAKKAVEDQPAFLPPSQISPGWAGVDAGTAATAIGGGGIIGAIIACGLWCEIPAAIAVVLNAPMQPSAPTPLPAFMGGSPGIVPLPSRFGFGGGGISWL